MADRAAAFLAVYGVVSARQLLFSFYLAPYNFKMLPQVIIAVSIPIVITLVALAGLRSTAPFGGPLDIAGLALFALGSALETGSELQARCRCHARKLVSSPFVVGALPHCHLPR